LGREDSSSPGGKGEEKENRTDCQTIKTKDKISHNQTEGRGKSNL